MATVKRLTEKQSDEYPYVYSYLCECGIPIELHVPERPDKLIRCSKCMNKSFPFGVE